MSGVRAIETPLATLGEGPMWGEDEGRLYWIDVVGKRVFRLDPATGKVETRELPYAPSAIYAHNAGGFLLVTKKGMARFDFERNAIESIAVQKVDFSREVFNDGACDSAGRLWIGTRDIETSRPLGRLYSIDPDYSVSLHDDGFVISNGMAFSPDGRLLYHIESKPGRIDVYDFDAERGQIAGRRVFVEYAAGEAPHPDGCAVDSAGGLWVAEVDGYRVARYAADGRLDRELKVPLRKPTSVTFGGRRLETLFITSMRFCMSGEELARQPLSGGLLAAETGFKGLPKHRFGAR